MSKFVLTAALKLKAPSAANVKAVRDQMNGQLQGVSVPVKITGTVAAAKNMNKVKNATREAAAEASGMAKTFGVALRRFAAFSIATRAVGLFTSKLSNAISEGISFERELIRISQVTGKTVDQLQDLSKTITNLSVELGASSKELISVTRILAQAGIQAENLKVVLTALAKTKLAPTFTDINKTAEGVIAIMSQFKEGAGAVEKQLGAINAVAGKFAVESDDLIGAVRRMGGVFRSAGGSLNELLGLFTSVRSTTRESAESIATGLRTIFTRIQRPATIEFLRQFGVELQDNTGKFIGAFKAARQLNKALAGLEQGDIRLVQVGEQLAGFRQIGKVIPLVQEFARAEEARQVAINGGNSLDADAVKAKKSLAVQIEQLTERTLAFVRAVTETGSFKTFVEGILKMSNNFLSLAESIKPLIPLLAIFSGFKILGSVHRIASGIGAGLGFSKLETGGIPDKVGGLLKGPSHALGGMKTMTKKGNAVELEGGEFVIRESSVTADTLPVLEAINAKKMSRGGSLDGSRGRGGRGADNRDAIGEGVEYTIDIKELDKIAKATKKSAVILDAIRKQSSKSVNKDSALEKENTSRNRGVKAAERKAVKDNGSLFPKTGDYNNVGKPFVAAKEADRARSLEAKDRYANENSVARKQTRDANAKRRYKAADSQRRGAARDKSIRLNQLSDFGSDSPQLQKHKAEKARKETSRRYGIQPPSPHPLAGRVPAPFPSSPLPGTSSRARYTAHPERADFIGPSRPQFETPVPSKFRRAASSVAGKVRNSITREKVFVPSSAPSAGFIGPPRPPIKGSSGGGGSDPPNNPPNDPKGSKKQSGRFNGTSAGLAALAALPILIDNIYGAADEKSGGFSKAARSTAALISQFAALGFAMQAFGLQLNAGSILKTLGSGFTQAGRKGLTKKALGGVAKLRSASKRVTVGGSEYKLLGSVTTGITKLGPVVARIAAFAGPIAAVSGGFLLLNTIVGSILDNTGKYNKAIKAGNVAKAKEFAVLQNVSSLAGISNVTAEFEQGVRNLFGGDSIAGLKANAEAAALAAQNTNNHAHFLEKSTKALERFEAGTISANEALKQSTDNFEGAVKESKAVDKANKEKLTGKSTGLGSIGRDLSNAITFGLVESVSGKNNRIDEEVKSGKNASQAKVKEELKLLKPLLRNQVQAGGGDLSFDEFFGQLPKSIQDAVNSGEAGTNKTILIEEFTSQSKAIKENVAFLESLNFGLRDVSGEAIAVAGSMKRLINSQESGGNRFDNVISVLEDSMTEAVNSMDTKEIADAQRTVAETLKSFGADPKQVSKATKTLDGLTKAQAIASTSLEEAGKALIDGGGSANVKAIQGVFTSGLKKDLKKLNVSPDVQQTIIDSLSELNFDDSNVQGLLRSGDVSSLIEKALGPLEKAAKDQVLSLAGAAQAQEKQLIDLTKQKISLENSYLQIRQRSIEVEAEAIGVISRANGDAFSSKDKSKSINQRLEILLSKAGVNSGGGAFSAQANITSAFRAITNTKVAGANAGKQTFLGSAGLRDDNSEDLKKAQEGILTYSKSRIALLQEEISIAERKNSLEKSALESLISGDLAGFFDKKKIVAATEALKSGDANALRGFTQKQKAAAFSNLETQNVDRATTDRAAGLVLGQYNNKENRDILTGGSDEIRQKQTEQKELAELMMTAAKGLEEMAEADITVKQGYITVVNDSTAAARRTRERQANQQQGQGQAVGLQNGGPVYASRGMFVPRGTDTVPAMLTPGEFVVNRAAVQRGNNMQLLHAMNNSKGESAAAMSNGGKVGYYNNGGSVGGGSDMLAGSVSALSNTFSGFSDSVDKLVNMKLSIKLDPTNVSVNFNNVSFLEGLESKMKDMVLNTVIRSLSNLTHDQLGNHRIGD